MLTPVTLTLIYSIGAGIMNGSFALPTKHIKTWNFENIWLTYAIWGFFLLPWLTVLFLDPQAIDIYRSMPTATLNILIIGGFLFGVGQICFATALRTIGLGLSFVVTIGLATALGCLLPLLTMDMESLLSPTGITTIVGLFFILIGLLLSYSAGHSRDKESRLQVSSSTKSSKGYFHFCVFLAILAGLFSAGQNYTFAITGNMQQAALENGIDPFTASIIIWPPFLTCTLIPYAFYMLYLHAKNKSFNRYSKPGLFQNSIFGIIMGCFWFGSVAIYSKASSLIGSLGPVIAWPLFMVLIILTSNFWAWRHKEWEGCSAAIKNRVILSIASLILSVLILTYSASLTH